MEKIIYMLAGIAGGGILTLCISGILLGRGKGSSGSSGGGSGDFYRGVGKVDAGLDILQGRKRTGGFGQK